MTTPENAPEGTPNAVPLNIGDAPPANQLPVEGKETVPNVPNPDPAKPNEKPTDPPKPDPVEYESTGDVGLDTALNFIGKAGLAADSPEMQAAIKGDFSLLRATLATKSLPGWEQHVALGEDAFKRLTAQQKQASEATTKAVLEVAGSAEAWADVRAWASQNATPEEKKQINSMLDAGGVQAVAAARHLVDLYSKANNVSLTPPDPTSGASRTNGVPQDSKPLSPTEYRAAVRDLNVKLRGRLDDSPEYKALQTRRLAYKG